MKLHSLRASQEEELRYTLLAKMGFADRKKGLLNPLEPEVLVLTKNEQRGEFITFI